MAPYHISTDKSLLNIELIHHYLSTESYWAKNIPLKTVQASIDNSVCFGIYDGGKQIGFARLITDKSTFAYLADVFILKEFRGNGLSKKLIDYILSHSEVQGLRRWMLATADAHGLYEQFGFRELSQPERFMEIKNNIVYTNSDR